MQLKITNRSTVQVPILVDRGGLLHSELLMPGVERTILGADVASVKLGRMSPGAIPSDPDSVKARENFLNGVDAMLGRSDGPAVATQVRMFIENFEGSVNVVDGGSNTTAIAAKEAKEVAALDAMQINPA